MNEEIPLLYADRMQFIVASMTKDYDKARDIANTRKRIDDDVDVSESDSELSVDSNSGNTDSNSDSNNSSQEIAEKKKERDLIGAKENSQRFDTTNIVFNSGKKAKVSYDPSYRHNVEIDDVKFRYNELKGKMIRVLPIRLSEKISRMK